MPQSEEPLEVVMAYVRALDSYRYDDAQRLLNEKVRVRGPAGETHGNPAGFIAMLRKYRGKYDIKKSFVDGDDVCLIYDLKTGGLTVFMASWYQVRDGRISSINTVFDPKAFGP